MAGTMFPEFWDKGKSGFDSFDDYVSSVYDLENISPADYEGCYERAYKSAWFNVSLAEGFPEVLIWAKHNAAFTTGLPQTNEWRAVQLKEKYGVDILPYIPKTFSTFDYGNTNVKTPEMLMDILKKKRAENYTAFVYTDDKAANCEFFLESYRRVKDDVAPMATRVYNITQTAQEIVQIKDNYWQVGTLLQLRENEQRLDKK